MTDGDARAERCAGVPLPGATPHGVDPRAWRSSSDGICVAADASSARRPACRATRRSDPVVAFWEFFWGVLLG